MNTNELIEMDLRHFWHPCAQMKDYADFPPMAVESAKGSKLFLKDGRVILDGISSWWCKSLGHAHPRIKKAFLEQVNRFEHVIMANCCAETVAELCSSLAETIPGLSRVFLAENGSVSVEIAIKMSLQYHAQSGHPEKKHFLSLENAYHGETILTLAAGDSDFYSGPFRHLLPHIGKLAPVPYLDGPDSPLWNNMPEEDWKKLETILDSHAQNLAGVLVEPVLQGAGGMKLYSPDLLRRLRKWTKDHGVHLIADEIFTGFGRTGEMMACQHAEILPDIATLSKGMTSGFVPLAAVMTTEEIYNAFYGDYLSGRAFVHSTTYSGYAPAAAAALEVLKVYREEQILESVRSRGRSLLERMKRIAASSGGALSHVRGIGFVAAADIVNPETGCPFPKNERTGFEFYKNAARLGALLRPIGDSFYFLPPLNTPEEELDQLADIAEKALRLTLAGKKVRHL